MKKKAKKKIAVITTTRAEYGLLRKLMHTIRDDAQLELQIIVTGMHLSPEFGLTYRFIEQDGFKIDAKVEMLMSSDTSVGMTKSMGLCLISLSEVLSQCAPDMIVVLGDRFETLAIAQAALLQKIPVAHVHGGELSMGAIDDAIRHAITKLSHLHFVAAEPYRKRVIQLGENPNTVFNVGAPGLERIKDIPLLARTDLEKIMDFKFGKLNFLVTFHPATLAIAESLVILENLFTALNQFPTAKIIFTLSNADESGRQINQSIHNFVAKHKMSAKAFTSLGDVNYISLLKYIDLIIGNSSSGIIEAPYFRKPTINIGTRQAKRLRTKTIIDCDGHGNSIVTAIKKALSNEFQSQLTHAKLAYQIDSSAKKITHTIKQFDLQKLLAKEFYDMDG